MPKFNALSRRFGARVRDSWLKTYSGVNDRNVQRNVAGATDMRVAGSAAFGGCRGASAIATLHSSSESKAA